MGSNDKSKFQEIQHSVQVCFYRSELGVFAGRSLPVQSSSQPSSRQYQGELPSYIMAGGLVLLGPIITVHFKVVQSLPCKVCGLLSQGSKWEMAR